MVLGRLAARVGIGLAAGLAGTVAITVSQLIEMRLRGRPPSLSPAKAVEQVFRIRPVDERAEKRLAELVHWGYGTCWGVFRAVLDTLGIRGPAATAVHLTAIEGGAMVMLPRLKVAPPVKQWGGQEIAIETVHHAVYASTVGAVYDYLKRELACERGVSGQGKAPRVAKA